MAVRAPRAADRAKAIDLIAAAKTAEAAGDAAGARAMLMEHRAAFSRVPPAYDAAIGRLSLSVGDAPAAIEYFTSAIDRVGDEAPLQWRRNLGTAMLLDGQIDAAGGEFCAVTATGVAITRRASVAAMEAFRQAETDAAAAAAYRCLARAELLADAGNVAGAHALLEQQRGAWPTVPAAYEAALGRLSLMLHDWADAALHLERARDTWRGELPAGVRRSLGTALFAIGRFAEAGRELSLAVDQGAVLGETAPRVAVNAYRAASGSGEKLDTRFGRSQVIMDRERRLVYCSIPKNGCTLLKANIFMNAPYREDYLASGQSVHDYAKKIVAEDLPTGALTSDQYFRFAVLRDPLRRLLSAYLNRLVRGRKSPEPFDVVQIARTTREAQASLGVPHDPARSISFEEFVRYLSTAADVQCDVHWMPQVNLVGTDLSVFSHVGKVERMDETLDMLASRFGYTVERDIGPHLRHSSEHITRYSETAALAQPYRALPDELDAHEDNIPMPGLFYTAELRELAERRYAADLALYAEVK